jgi:hypothetical protein
VRIRAQLAVEAAVRALRLFRYSVSVARTPQLGSPQEKAGLHWVRTPRRSGVNQ